MEQSDENLNRAIATMERQLTTCRDSTSCNLPMGVLLTLAKILRDECDARRAIVRMAEHRDQLAQGTAQRLTGEIAERSQRQLEITGRLAALERRMSMREVVVTPERPQWEPGDHDAGRGFRRLLDRHERVLEERNETQAGTITELERDLANARADAQVHQSARRALEIWAEQIRTALGAHPHESRPWMVAEVGRLNSGVRTVAKVRDLEAQVTALQKAIDDVWALVEMTDGYGSPFWSEPGLDDTTPAQAVAAVLEHLRAQLAEHEAEGALRRQDYTSELTEALGYGTGTIVWHRALDLVRETILQRNGAREQVATQATAYTQLTTRVRTLEERNTTQAATIRSYQLGDLLGTEAMAALNAVDRQSDDDQICGC